MAEHTDELIVDPDYLEGFNAGYSIAEADPELAASLSSAIPESFKRAQGFKDGYRQYGLEKDLQFYPSWIDKEMDEHIPDKDIDKDKDDYELEIE